MDWIRIFTGRCTQYLLPLARAVESAGMKLPEQDKAGLVATLLRCADNALSENNAKDAQLYVAYARTFINDAYVDEDQFDDDDGSGYDGGIVWQEVFKHLPDDAAAHMALCAERITPAKCRNDAYVTLLAYGLVAMWRCHTYGP